MGFWIVSSETFISDQQGHSQRTVIVFSFLHSIGIVTIGMWNPSALLIHCTYASMRRSRCNNKSLWTMFVCVSYKCSSVFCCLCVFFCHCQFVFTVEHSPRFSASFQYCVLESSRSGISFVDGDRAARKMQTVEKRRHVERKSEKRREKWKNDSDEQRMHVAHAIHATI